MVLPSSDSYALHFFEPSRILCNYYVLSHLFSSPTCTEHFWSEILSRSFLWKLNTIFSPAVMISRASTLGDDYLVFCFFFLCSVNKLGFYSCATFYTLESWSIPYSNFRGQTMLFSSNSLIRWVGWDYNYRICQFIAAHSYVIMYIGKHVGRGTI